MISISYKNRLFNFIEHIGNTNNLDTIHENVDTDVILKMELSLSVPEEKIQKIDQYKHSIELTIPNFLIDLRQKEEIIYKNFHNKVRAEIRKATELNHLSYFEVDNPSDAQIKDFSIFYNKFAIEKKIATCNLEKLISIRNQNSLVMNYVKDEENNILCSDMMIVDKDFNQLYSLYGATTRFLQTNQKERKKVGRANKLSQWKKIQSAKNRGLDWFNFGGEVKEKGSQGINEFKQGFGTKTGGDRRIYIPKSTRGRICVALIYYKWKRIYLNSQAIESDSDSMR